MEYELVRAVDVERTPRVLQLEGLFDVPPTRRSEERWHVRLPLEERPWSLGLVVGPSGSGKTTVAREAFGAQLATSYDWPERRSVVDAFPAGMSIKDITALLSSVGFSSPPSWLRPFACLSNGEQFRVTLARALGEAAELTVVDEFTSVVDRTVAQVGSAAVARAVRRLGKKFVAVTCHYDVQEWLDPDWVLEMPAGTFTWRSLQGRPPISLTIRRVRHTAWELFRRHHYLDTHLHRAAWCFMASWRERPVAFASAMTMPGRKTCIREHRTVCLPDFQGVGIGNALSEYVASLLSCVRVYTSTTSNPAMIRHRQRSPVWVMKRKPSLLTQDKQARNPKYRRQIQALAQTRATTRLTAGFEYIGPKRPDEARRFGLL